MNLAQKTIAFLRKKLRHLAAGGAALTVSGYLMFSVVMPILAAPPTSVYQPGETLNPTCAPTDVNCTVASPAVGTASTTQLAFWTGTSTVAGSANLTYTPGTGVLSITATSTFVGGVTVNGTAILGSASTTGMTFTNATGTTLALTGLTSGSIPFVGTGGIFSQNNANLFWDNTNFRFGIGTSQPSSTLHISGATSTFSIVSTQTGGKRFDIRSGSAASGTLDIYDFASSTSRLAITQEGFVGIGTAQPSSTLHVVGDLTVTATSTFSGTTIMDNAQVGAMSFDSDAGMVTWVDMPVTASSTAGTVERYTARLDGNAMISVYGTADGSGGVSNLGVGIGTVEPSSTLHVAGATSSIVSISTTQTGGKRYDFRVGGVASDTLDIYDFTSSTSRFFVAGNGNIGIGTTQPSSTLHMVTVSSASALIGAQSVLGAGYTGASGNYAFSSQNLVAGTGADWSTGNVGNISINGNSSGAGSGRNIGVMGQSSGSSGVNIGVGARSGGANTLNVGMVGTAFNSTYNIGGLFTLENNPTIPSVTTALIANNSTYANNIFVAQDNGTAVFTIADGAITSLVNSTGFGIGTAQPSSTLHVVGDLTVTATSTFSGAAIFDNAQFGAMAFEPDAGIVSWMDLPVTASSSAGTTESYISYLDGNPILTIYGVADGNGSVGGLGVGIMTLYPSSTLHVYGTTTSTISLGNSITGGRRFDLRLGSMASGTLDIYDFTSSTSRLAIDETGRVGIGTAQPSSTLHVIGDLTVSATSTFSGTTILDNAQIGSLWFDTDAGMVTMADMLVTASSSAGTVESYTSYLDGNPMLTIYGTSDGAGGVGSLGVGIGTTSPSSTLHVYGTTTSTISLGNSITGGKRFDLRVGSAASGTFDIYDFSSSSSRLAIDATGQLGIGTTQPSSTLHVVGNLTVTATSTFSGTTILDNAQVGSLWFDTDAGMVTLADMPVTASSTAGTIESYTSYLDGNPVLTVYGTADGNGGVGSLGVGIMTLYPSSTLHVYGTATSTFSLGNSIAGGKRYDFRVGAISSGTLDIYDFTSSTSRFFVDGNGNIGIGTTQPSSTLHVLGTLTTSATTTLVTAGGSVGIGTITPQAKLDIFQSGSFNTTIPGLTRYGLHLTPQNATPSTAAGITFGAGNSGAGQTAQAGIYSEFRSDGTRLYFATTDNYGAGATTRIMIDPTGFVGIGTVFPSSTLHIAGATSTFSISSTQTGGKRFDLRVGSAASGTLDIYDFASSTSRLAITQEGFVGIGTAQPSSTLHVVGDLTVTATSTFSGAAIFDNAQFGTMSFEQDAGIISWADMAVTASSTASTTMSYTAQLDGNPMLTIYGESDGLGGTQRRGIGIATTTPAYALVVGDGATQADIYVPRGAICIDSDAGGCPAVPTQGVLYASSTAITAIDLAENYPTNDASLEAGDIVTTDSANHEYIVKATSTSHILGVISTAPGVLLGRRILNARPVALAGRVPVKVSDEHGAISIGDPLTLSTSTPGVAVKQLVPGTSIGIALEAYPSVIPAEAGIQPSSTSTSPSTSSQPSQSSGGQAGNNSTSTPKISVFVNTGFSLGTLAEIASSTETSFLTDFARAVQHALASLGATIQNGIASVKELISDKVTTKRLCIDDVCIEKSQLQQMLNNAGSAPAAALPPQSGAGQAEVEPIPVSQPAASEPTPEPAVSEPAPVVEPAPATDEPVVAEEPVAEPEPAAVEEPAAEQASSEPAPEPAGEPAVEPAPESQ